MSGTRENPTTSTRDCFILLYIVDGTHTTTEMVTLAKAWIHYVGYSSEPYDVNKKLLYFIAYCRRYAYHGGDGNSCPSNRYIMSGTQVNPTTSTIDCYSLLYIVGCTHTTTDMVALAQAIDT